MNEPIYASDLMSEARKNPEKYEGKKYSVAYGNLVDVCGKLYNECVVDGKTLRATDDDGLRLYASEETQLEEIKPEPIPVPFMETIKAFLKGKTIKCKWTGFSGKECTSTYIPKGEYTQLCDDEGAICAEEIMNGVWYIVEEDTP